nr:DALR anticodon-binding domain-containing protein 3 [Leptinotarsa decemlineata]
MFLLESFVLDLQNYLIGTREIDHGMIELRLEKPAKVGDVSFPLSIRNWSHLLNGGQCTGDCISILDYKGSKKDLGNQIEQLRMESLKWTIQIDKILMNNKQTHLNISLSRTSKLFKSVLKEVIEAEKTYGSSDFIRNKVHLDLFPNNDLNSESSLTCLRLHLLKEITANLLKASTCSETDRESRITLSLQPVDDRSKNVICGPVLTENGNRNSTTVQQLYEKRASDMRMMAQHKYGVQITPSSTWETYFANLGKGCVTIEMMSNKPQKAIKVTQNDLQTAHKGPCFIFYNCARLAALFKKFEKLVTRKEYPDLPEIDGVDFSLLTQQEEWELFYAYILQYPIVVKSCIKHIETGVVNPQYLVTFLSKLASLFSVYYRRVRILTNPREHMFAVVHARMYLLKAIQYVFHNALDLLNIEPIREM